MEKQGHAKREMGSRSCVVLGGMAGAGGGAEGGSKPAGPEGRDMGAGRYLGLFVLLAPFPLAWLPDVLYVPIDSSASSPERLKRNPCNFWVEKSMTVI